MRDREDDPLLGRGRRCLLDVDTRGGRLDSVTRWTAHVVVREWDAGIASRWRAETVLVGHHDNLAIIAGRRRVVTYASDPEFAFRLAYAEAQFSLRLAKLAIAVRG